MPLPPARNPPWQLIDARSGRLVVASLEVADTFWRRFRGLQWRPALPAGHGLLLVPCRSIHTACMRFAIDAVWLDRAATVLAVEQEIRPWSIRSAAPAAYAVLELPSATARLEPGDRLVIRSTGQTLLPQSLHFLAPGPAPDK